MYGTVDFHIRGVSPLLMHNGQLADPTNRFAKALKAVTGKRKKTDEDHAEMSKIEFHGGLYVNADGHPIIPGEILEATIINGAKGNKLGKTAKSAVFVDGDAMLIYDGPKTPEKLFADDNFRLVTSVRVNQARVMRTRPKFAGWELKFSVNYLTDALNERDIVDAVENAGRVVGLCDGRPRYGRFELVSTSAVHDDELAAVA